MQIQIQILHIKVPNMINNNYVVANTNIFSRNHSTHPNYLLHTNKIITSTTTAAATPTTTTTTTTYYYLLLLSNVC